MFNYRNYLDTFLSDYKHQIFSNNSVAKIDRFFGNEPHFHIIGIHKLTSEENSGKHNLYLEIVNNDGKRLPEKIQWGWIGQRDNEIANPVILDKPDNEPSGNISLGGFQIVWAQVLGKPSDRIFYVTTGLPDEGPGNTWGHHSYLCVWQFIESTIVVPPIEPPIPTVGYAEGVVVGRTAMKKEIMELISKL